MRGTALLSMCWGVLEPEMVWAWSMLPNITCSFEAESDGIDLLPHVLHLRLDVTLLMEKQRLGKNLIDTWHHLIGPYFLINREKRKL